MRAMFLEFPQDRSMWYLDQQYMLGGSLLVAPVFGESEVEYYLPPGTWTNILTGQEAEGPGWKKESHTMMTLPVLLRPGHAVIMGKEGHRVTDSIGKRGFTVMVSRQINEITTISTALRGGKTIDVVLEPLKDASSSNVSGIKVSSKGIKAAFDVIVLGGGQGLDSQNLVSAEAQNGVCEVRFA
jgi:alpha-D-xyloside xylohydrolase